MIRLERRFHDQIVKQALEELPNEACGLIAARDGTPTRLYRMQNADTNAAAANMQNYGGANWSAAGTSKKYKYAAKAANLAAAINATLATVSAMPKGRGASNRQRMLAWFDGMSSFYGKI